MASTHQTIQRLRENDVQAFNELYQENWSKFYRFAVRLLKDESAAEDLIQNFFKQVWEKRNNFPEEVEQVDSFLFRWMQRMLLNQIKADQIREKHMDAFISVFVAYEEYTLPEIYEKETYRQIKSAADKLPERMREIFLMNRIDHIPTKEIAIKFNLSEQTVRNQISNALSRIRAEVDTSALIAALVIWTGHVK